jgi:hypothetical protein
VYRLRVARDLGNHVRLSGYTGHVGEGGRTERVEDYTSFYGEGNEDHQLGTGFVVHKKIVSAVRRVEFIGCRISHIILRGHLCRTVVLTVRAVCEDKSDDVKYSFCGELGRVFD